MMNIIMNMLPDGLCVLTLGVDQYRKICEVAIARCRNEEIEGDLEVGSYVCGRG